MIKLRTIIPLVLMTCSIFAQEISQEQLVGKVEYISSQFTYVNFEKTKGIEEGDTLFVYTGKKLLPQLIVNALSSRSCAAINISGKVKLGDEVIAIIEKIEIADKRKSLKPSLDIIFQDKEVKPKIKSSYGKFNRSIKGVYGRFSLSGYSNLSNDKSRVDYQNWRYS